MSQQRPDRSAEHIPLIPAVILFGAVTLVLVLLFANRPSGRPAETAAVVGEATQAATATVAVAAEATQAATAAVVGEATQAATAAVVGEATQAAAPQVAAAGVDPQRVMAGEMTYQSVCTACHGFNAMGIQGLGKPLIGSEFVNSLSDEELVAFIAKGRDMTDPLNTTGIMMPARGGNPTLTDNDLLNVVHYIRDLNVKAGFAPSTAGTVGSTGGAEVAQVVTATVAAPTATPAGPTAVPTEWQAPVLTGVSALVPTAVSEAGGASSFGNPGQTFYVRACAACHGGDGRGVPMLGTSLFDSQLVLDRDGAALLEFLSKEQPPVNPEVAYPHPARGGYPPLNDQDIQSVIAYMYTLTASQ